MLINWHDPDHVYLVCGKTDLRKGIDGLAIVVAENYGLELSDRTIRALSCVMAMAVTVIVYIPMPDLARA